MKKISWRMLLVMVSGLLLLMLAGCTTLDASAAFSALQTLSNSTSAAEPGATPTQIPTLGVVSFKGTVDSLSSDSLVVEGLTFRIDEQTALPEGLQTGDAVVVKAVLLPDDSRYALEVTRLEKTPDESEFKFYGVVESISGTTWVVSGETIQVTLETQIEAGIEVGSLVEVEGVVSEGNLIAYKISLEDDEVQPSPQPTPGESEENNEVEWFGVLNQMTEGAWIIGDQTVQVTPETELKGNPRLGDLVKVHAVQTDGGYVAHEIEKIRSFPTAGAPQARNFKFYGTVESINGSTWVVSGVTVTVDTNTKLQGNPSVGSQVEVKALVQADGTYLATQIKVKESGSGRLDFRATPGSEDDHESDSLLSTPQPKESHDDRSYGNSEGKDHGGKSDDDDHEGND
ncbi:DUF5666 domain-containing protein [Thermanaerothrix sp. 4228-RoL]|uniref:DUF5666 domain-containing protein n=1 Tax=Thermanaerothrix solaris TaxID=3058434 RepID=A0ABU3NPA6_9CHLR|nr:DUF5666 domain-containing protein [Thermanaerothrix sp. 4228-RoL]MDT8898674.1 DUF5666 domain-containing protein [Thermanaerothrix sp. 4228-RoL]